MPMNWSLTLVSNQKFTSKFPFFEAIHSNKSSCTFFAAPSSHFGIICGHDEYDIDSKVSKRKLSAIRGKKNFRAKRNMFFAGESVRL